MLHVDIPTLPEIRALIAMRSDACVSIYVRTTPQSQHMTARRIAFGNQTKAALEQLDTMGFDKRRLAALAAELAALGEDNAFWRLQAHSLAILATPDSMRTFRLATAITDTTEVSDRFHLKPCCRPLLSRRPLSCSPCRRALCDWSRYSPISRLPWFVFPIFRRVPPVRSNGLRSTT
jgi:hypothetical protein